MSAAAPGKNALNLLSAAFDPHLALTAPSVPVPFPDVAPLNNMNECRRLLPESAAAAMAPIAAPYDAGASSSSNAPAPAASSSVPRRLSAKMHDELSQGVLGVLSGLKKQLVRVVVHRGDGLRGIVEGRLQVYDKFLNLVLRDAVERYVPYSSQASGASGSTSTHANDWTATKDTSGQGCWRKRMVAQLLIRGDGVMSVCKRPDERHDMPAAARAAFRARAVLVDAKGDAPAYSAAAAAAASGDDGPDMEEAAEAPAAHGAAVAFAATEDDDGDEDDDEEGDDYAEDWDGAEHMEHLEEHYCGDAMEDGSQGGVGQGQRPVVVQGAVVRR